ncbi:MAG: protein translocase subunit SecDF, partial [Bacteroidota bacterium]|nr:protein translocase subunit SecDF [Bacteroidota bacterium]MDX5431741.1 protein translocase subunit SecDF [Bacteroidota bacterium]MDX5470456.1 protein translocase subunit SecDF [Bacteroidota bacterium]
KYLDSISGTVVYNLGLREYTYLQVKERELNLGLDLQGGMNVTLEVSLPDVIIALANNTKDPKFLQAIANASEKATNSQENYVTLFVEAIRGTAPNTPLSTWFAHKDNKDKVSFNSSDEDVITFLRNEADDAVERTYRILRSRIDRFGVSQPVIQKLDNSGRIMVELPGVSDPTRARKLLQQSAKLEFWNVYSPNEGLGFLDKMDKALKARIDIEKGGAAPEDTTASNIDPITGETTTADDTTTKADTTKSDDLITALNSGNDTTAQDTGAQTFEQFKEDRPLIAALANGTTSFLNMDAQGQIGGGAELAFVSAFDTAMVNTYLNDPELRDVIPGDVVFAWGNKPKESNIIGLYALRASRDGGPDLEGDVVTDSRSQIGSTGGFEVSMSMNQEGRQVWKRMTAAASSTNPKGHVAVVLDGIVYSAPVVNGEIPNGQTSISGNFTQDDTKFLANILKSGKLPAPARIVEEAIVGPSLGKAAISSGLYSILAGFLSVILIMAVIYSAAGWVANLAVLLNLFFMLGVLSSLGAALTLPGIAGIILTLGMAVDANVLIYERVKEELAAGKNLRNAITGGYSSALSAILDSNITTLLTGIVLYAFGSGPIFGFSITLIIGILSSLFTAILMTRLVFEWALKREKEVKFSIPATANLLKNVNINFIGNRMKYYTVSGIIIVAGISSILYKGLDFGVDFRGGWSYVVKFENPSTSSELRNILATPLGSSPEVKVFGDNNTFKITTDYNIDDNGTEAAEKVTAKLAEGLTPLNNKYTVESTSRVGPTIADDIKFDAVKSVLIALILMFIYILIRFRKWQFATGTVIKLTHDVLIVLGLFSLLDGIVPFTLEIDQSFIAAILTVIGYSINDSVVVMDRVREYLNENRKGSIKSIINDALNSTLSRTMITSLTTLGVLVILFLFGGEVIRGFSFAMVVGVFVGSYSSICIGAPLTADLIKEEEK